MAVVRAVTGISSPRWWTVPFNYMSTRCCFSNKVGLGSYQSKPSDFTKHFRTSSLIIESSQRSYSSSSNTQGLSYIHYAGKFPLEPVTLVDLPDVAVRLYGNREAFVDCSQGIRRTFTEFRDDVNQFARGLLTLGLQKGERVGIWSPNCYQWCVSSNAAAATGAIVVPMNPTYQAKEVDYCLKHAGIKVLITASSVRGHELYKVLSQLMPGLEASKSDKLQFESYPQLKNIIMISEKSYPGVRRYQDIFKTGESYENQSLLAEIMKSIQLHEAAFMLYTSGSTGQPKGVIWNHHAVANKAIVSAQRSKFYLKPHRYCVPAPFFHAIGVMAGLINLTQGVCTVLPSAFYSPKACLEAIHKEKCSIIVGTPTMFLDIMGQPDFNKYDLSSLEMATVGGATSTKEILTTITKKFNNVPILNNYGCSECTVAITAAFPDDNSDNLYTYVGKPVDHAEVKLIDTKGNVVPLGAPGELLTRGYFTMTGYWNDEARTKEAFTEDNWFRTGDILTMNKEGYFSFIGRIKDIIIRGGENIHPSEVETVVLGHPKVHEVHVFGVPDQRLGEQVCAWILLKKGENMTETEMKDFCKQNMAPYKIPYYIRFVNEFPKLAAGKVAKSVMRDEMISKLKT